MDEGLPRSGGPEGPLGPDPREGAPLPEEALREDSLLARLRALRGEDFDPRVSLDGGPEVARGASLLVERLRAAGFRDGRYRLQDELARGGMGAILRIWDDGLRRHLAMKVLMAGGTKDQPPSLESIDARALARFLEEAHVTGQLDHPGIVPVHELGLDSSGSVWFTMRLVKGRDLRAIFDLVRDGAEGWTQTRALGVMLKVCEAMAYAHAKGVIHRDLKPANVMVGRFGEVYVMDWGLARVLGREDRHDPRVEEPSSAPPVAPLEGGDLDPLRTMDGDVLGTPAYMAPEQAFGRLGEVGPRADVYAVGAMLYHLIAGRMPHAPPGEPEDPFSVLMRVRKGPPVPLHDLESRAAPELEAICEKAMAREPAGRYADMQELAEDLRAYLEGRVVHAYERGAWAEIKKWVLRNKLVAALSMVALASLLGGLLVSASLYVRAERDHKRAEESAALAERRSEEAQRSEELALRRQAEAEAQRVQVLRLADAKRLEQLEGEASVLWPADPERVPAYAAWLERARELSGRLAAHREAFAALRAQALAAPEDPAAPEGAWLLPSAEEQWQHDLLGDLVQRIEAFLDPEKGRAAEVEERLAFADTVTERSLTGPEAVRAWEGALASIADPRECPAYAGLRIRPQLGLLPLGRDPRSGLWEFAHLQSGAVPERDAQGSLVADEESAIVLVLLPGGRFAMGAQPDDEGEPNLDPFARDNERPVHELELAPFFLGKWELTQGQWWRFARSNPSNYKPGVLLGGLAFDASHPVEQVSWEECERVLWALGLELPSEAQWEYGARAGSETPWWTGATSASLAGAANIADRAASRAGATWDSIRELPDFDDGFAVHAPVGRLAPNPFGLHDVHGNVIEWCRDWFLSYDRPLEPESGLRQGSSARYRVYRGGGFIYSASAARSAARDGNAPSFKGSGVGLRAARRIDP